jgi:hypothetical protein
MHLDHMSFSILTNLIPQNCSEKWWGGELETDFMKQSSLPHLNEPPEDGYYFIRAGNMKTVRCSGTLETSPLGGKLDLL